MVPVFIVNGHDYTEYIQEIKPSRNDLDADGSGRNLLNGLMYRKRISSKAKLSVSFLRLDEDMMEQLEQEIKLQEQFNQKLLGKINKYKKTGIKKIVRLMDYQQ